MVYFAGALSSLFAALLFVVGRKGLVERRRRQRLLSGFWARQKKDGLDRLFAEGAPGAVPAPIDILLERSSMDGTIQAIVTARELDVLKYLEEHPGARSEDLTTFLGFSDLLVRSWIELLQAAGVVERRGEGLTLTRAARFYLSPDSPFYDATLPAPTISRATLRSLRTGKVARSPLRWARGEAHLAELWGVVAHRFSFQLGFALDRSGILPARARILDVAGGLGSVSVGLALCDSTREITLIELPGSVGLAERMARCYGVSDRIQCLGKDMFSEPWPDRFDVVLFTNVLHSWSDEKCLDLARRAFASLSAGGMVLIQEALLDEAGPGPLWTAHLSLAVALDMQGRQFRGSQLRTILQEAGFEDIRVEPLLGYSSVVVGVRHVPKALGRSPAAA